MSSRTLLGEAAEDEAIRAVAYQADDPAVAVDIVATLLTQLPPT